MALVAHLYELGAKKFPKQKKIELDGLEATRIITEMSPTTRVILVSTYAHDDLPPRARTSGAMAYVNKDELSPRVIRRLWESGGDPDWLATD